MNNSLLFISTVTQSDHKLLLEKCPRNHKSIVNNAYIAFYSIIVIILYLVVVRIEITDKIA